MDFRNKIILLAVVAVLIFLFGCTGSGGNFSREYTSTFSRTALDYSQNQLTPGSCVCMVCKNGSSFFPFFNSLVGGSCRFEESCTEERFNQLVRRNDGNNDDEILRQFMIGQGGDLADFGQANPYCNNKLSMAVQWLLGDRVEEYRNADPQRAVCLLDKGVMPVYVLHSAGNNIDSERSFTIARTLGRGGRDVTMGHLSDGPVGPVVITTEMDINSTFTDVQIDAVKRQIRSLNEGCENNRASNPPQIKCMVALGVQMNDRAVLERLMNDPQVKNNVDLVAFGINSNKMNTCNPAQMIEEARGFASHVLYTYKKPTIMPYIIFDAQGTSADGTCQMNDFAMRQGYSLFFSGEAVSFAQRGVIGAAPYSFNSTGMGGPNPLVCKDCNLGKTVERLSSWFGGCQAYTNITTRLPGGQEYTRASPGTLLNFPNGPATVCDYNQQLDYVFRNMQFGDGGFGRDFSSIQAPPLEEPQQALIRCDACITRTLAPSPFNFGARSFSPTGVECTAFPSIENWASRNNLDPLFVRASITTESGFNTCDAEKVCIKEVKSGTGGRTATTGCFNQGNTQVDDECYGFGYDLVTDPEPHEIAGETALRMCQVGVSGEIPQWDTQYVNPSIPTAEGIRPGWRICAMGLMQSLEPPYTFWPARYTHDSRDSQYAWVFEHACDWDPERRTCTSGLPVDMLGAIRCNPTNFNPFNPNDGLCIGTTKLGNYMEQMRREVPGLHSWQTSILGRSESADLLGWAGDDPQVRAEKDEIFAAYLAANRYSGFLTNVNLIRDGSRLDQRCRSRHAGDSRFSNGQIPALYCYLEEFYESREACRPNLEGVVTNSACLDADDNVLPLSELKKYPKCLGYTDPIEFIRYCMLTVENVAGWANVHPTTNPMASSDNSNTKIVVDRGGTKMSAYFGLRSSCQNSGCPDWRNIYNTVRSEDPAYASRNRIQVDQNTNPYISRGAGTPVAGAR